jgi:hypothetical protein
MNVIVGVRKDGTSWKQAQEDGWVPGKNLFDVEEAIKKGTIVMNLLSVRPIVIKLTSGCRSKRNMDQSQAPPHQGQGSPLNSPN